MTDCGTDPNATPGADMTLTLKQVAELAGVSRSTASRVLNEHPGVRPEVRERVLQVIRDYGFHPDPTARLLASRRSQIIEADLPDASLSGTPAGSTRATA
jgi:LacI family transcriptional regulator